MSIGGHHHHGLGWTCESVDERLKSIESGRDKLKAELEAVKKNRDFYQAKPYIHSVYKQLEADRDLWKQRCEKLADRLRWTDEALDVIQDASSIRTLHKRNEETLASLPRGEKGIGQKQQPLKDQ